jgi:hypothetical protein
MTVTFNSTLASIALENECQWIPLALIPGVDFRIRALTCAPFVAKHDAIVRKLARQRFPHTRG